MGFRRGVTICGVDVAKRLDEELAAGRPQLATADGVSAGQSRKRRGKRTLRANPLADPRSCAALLYLTTAE